MKIVDVCPFYTPAGGGVRTYVDQKLAIGPRLGHEIVVLAPGAAHRVERRGPHARIVYLPAPRLPLDRRYRYFLDDGSVQAALDREAPDFVEASSPWRSAETVAHWRGSAPRALVMHADPLASYAYRWFGMVARREWIDRTFGFYWRHLQRLDARFDAVIAANASLTQRLRDGGLSGVSTNPMGVAPDTFSPNLRDEALRAELLRRCGLTPQARLLIGIGRHAPEKRWPMVIDACVAAGRERDLGLVLIGDGRERRRIVDHIGGNPHIQLLAPLRDRGQFARLLASADALVHGCESETFCMVGAEAAASGLAIVAPDEGGAASFAAAYGARFRVGDANAAARAIDRVLGSRPPLHALPGPVRTMVDHFDQLFRHYETLTRARAA
jgi:alpha-1,6-mannosyltransferase